MGVCWCDVDDVVVGPITGVLIVCSITCWCCWSRRKARQLAAAAAAGDGPLLAGEEGRSTGSSSGYGVMSASDSTAGVVAVPTTGYTSPHHHVQQHPIAPPCYPHASPHPSAPARH